jgi:hypothetical protein
MLSNRGVLDVCLNWRPSWTPSWIAQNVQGCQGCIMQILNLDILSFHLIPRKKTIDNIWGFHQILPDYYDHENATFYSVSLLCWEYFTCSGHEIYTEAKKFSNWQTLALCYLSILFHSKPITGVEIALWHLQYQSTCMTYLFDRNCLRYFHFNRIEYLLLVAKLFGFSIVDTPLLITEKIA